MCCLWHRSIINSKLQILASCLCNKLSIQCRGDLTEFTPGWLWMLSTWHRRAQRWATSCFRAMLERGRHSTENPEVNPFANKTSTVDQRQRPQLRRKQNSSLVILWFSSRVGPNNASYPLPSDWRSSARGFQHILQTNSKADSHYQNHR